MSRTPLNINNKQLDKNWTMTVDLIVNGQNEAKDVEIALVPNVTGKYKKRPRVFFPVSSLPWLINTLQTGRAWQEELAPKKQLR
jgi:hypothetical protein